VGIVNPNPISAVNWQPLVLDGRGAEHPRLVRLTWERSDSGAEGVVQVYVDGRLHDALPGKGRRSAWLGVDRRNVRRVELLVVTPDSAWEDFGGDLKMWSTLAPAQRVEILRLGGFAYDGSVEISGEGQGGAGPGARISVWAGAEARPGFGGGLGMEDAFGFDAAVGPGLGAGSFGVGPFGSDGVPIIRRLPAGWAGGTVMVEARGPAGESQGSEVLETAALPAWPAAQRPMLAGAGAP